MPKQSEWKFSPFLFTCSLLGYVTGPKRLWDYLQSTAQFVHTQWEASCEATGSHSWLPPTKHAGVGDPKTGEESAWVRVALDLW